MWPRSAPGAARTCREMVLAAQCHDRCYLQFLPNRAAPDLSRSANFSRYVLRSAVNLLAMAHAENQHHQAFVFDFADEPVIAHTVFPELA